MKKREFKSVNKILKSELSNEYNLELIEVVRQLMPIVDGVIDTELSFDKRELIECNTFSFYQAQKYVCDRLPLFYRELLRMRNDGEIHYSRTFANNSECDSRGHLWLGRSDTIQDDLFFIHEFIHHMNLKPYLNDRSMNKNVVLRDLFGESLSIFGELDFANTLEDEKLKNDARKSEANYMLMVKHCAIKTKIELFLIDLYLKHGELNEDIIKEAIKNIDDLEFALMVSQRYEEVLYGIDGWGANLKIIFNMKYVLGLVVGYQLFDKLKDDENMVYKLSIICRRMYELSIDDFCKLFDIDLTDPKMMELYKSKVEEINNLMKDITFKQ